jgi:hypothetical protein
MSGPQKSPLASRPLKIYCALEHVIICNANADRKLVANINAYTIGETVMK